MSTVQATNIKSAASASNNIVLDASGNATFAGTAVMASSFLRNRIINGGMDIWQRGTSFSSPSGGAYLADRYFTFGTVTSFSRSTDVPTGFRYSASMVGTDASVYQKIEDLNCDGLIGGSVTFSFFARSTSGTGALNVTLVSPTAANNYSSFTTIYNASVSASPSGSWTRYTVTASVDANIVNGLQCQIARSGAGTTLITGLQLEVGSVATPFERRLYGQELALCQRYAWVSNLRTLAPGGMQSTNAALVETAFPVTMRATPTISVSGSVTVDDYFSTTTTGPLSGATAEVSGASFLISGLTTLSPPRPMHIAPGNNAVFTISAEL